jgi:hypothetical protein
LGRSNERSIFLNPRNLHQFGCVQKSWRSRACGSAVAWPSVRFPFFDRLCLAQVARRARATASRSRGIDAAAASGVMARVTLRGPRRITAPPEATTFSGSSQRSSMGGSLSIIAKRSQIAAVPKSDPRPGLAVLRSPFSTGADSTPDRIVALNVLYSFSWRLSCSPARSGCRRRRSRRGPSRRGTWRR